VTFPGDPGGFGPPKAVIGKIRASKKPATAILEGYSDELIERPLGVRVEIVEHQRHSLAVGITRVQEVGDLDRPVLLGPSLAGGRLPEARERLGEHEDAGGAVAFVFVIDSLSVLLRRGDRHPGLLEQLDRLLVHAEHGLLRIIGFRAGLEHFFHAGDELGVLLRRDHPVFDLPLGHPVFF
jgi:hypothetical protein